MDDSIERPAHGAAAVGEARSPFAVIALLLLASVYTLYFAADLLIPIAAAFLLNLVLSPVVRLLGRAYVPPTISAAILVAGLVALWLGAFVALAQPAAHWLERAPGVVSQLEAKLSALKGPIDEVRQASERVERATSMRDEGQAPREVAVKSPGLLEQLLGTLQKIGVHIAFTLFLLFFLLASGNMFTEKLVKVLPRLQDKKRAVLITREVEEEVSAYLFTVTAINAGLGLVIGVALHGIGLPNAVLWGAMAMVLNFVPYLGAAVGAAVVGVVAIIEFDSIGYALLAPACYVALNTLEGNVVTPLILSRRLTMNPVGIFISVAFWGWIWGVPGALMAVPLLTTIKVLCDHVERFRPVGEFLGGRQS